MRSIRRIRSWQLLVALATLAFATGACGGGGDDDGDSIPPTLTQVTASQSELLIAFTPNPDQPGASATPLRLVDLAGGENRDIGDAGVFIDVAFSPDGAFVATADTGGAARIYDVATGEDVATSDGTEVTSLDWAPEGSSLAVIRAESVTVLVPGVGEQAFDFGAGPGSNQLSWAWSPDGAVFALVTADGLALQEVSEGGVSTTIPAEEFPAEAETWVVRTGSEAHEIGLVDLAPVSGLPEGRGEYPVILQDDGTVTGGEFRYVSIYDWGTLPSPQFDQATALRFPSIRKSCDPCRSADGGASLIMFWTAGSGPTPTPDVTQWPAGTSTYLAVEGVHGQATAVDLGIVPTGALAVPVWAPIYDVVRVGP
jgi:dipeptidyl aminopeptidase/acylaminoacyl peptidase